MRLKGLIGGLFLALLMGGCTYSSYDTGDGDYSSLRADFGILMTNAKAQIESFLSDDDVTYHFSVPTEVESLKPDTIYRALVYYDYDGVKKAKLRGTSSVGVVTPSPLKENETMKTDPVHWESTWISANASYINLALSVMTGASDYEELVRQRVGMVTDSVSQNRHYLTLYHDQAGQPEYYSRKIYVSIPVKENFASGDEVIITANTYEGLLRKTLIVP